MIQSNFENVSQIASPNENLIIFASVDKIFYLSLLDSSVRFHINWIWIQSLLLLFLLYTWHCYYFILYFRLIVVLYFETYSSTPKSHRPIHNTTQRNKTKNEYTKSNDNHCYCNFNHYHNFYVILCLSQNFSIQYYMAFYAIEPKINKTKGIEFQIKSIFIW